MDANYILAWIAGLSALTWGVRAYQTGASRQSEWVLVAGLVLFALAAGLLLAPAYAGYVAGALWALLLLLPALGNRWVNQLMIRHRFGLAALASRVLAWVHPTREWRRRHRHLEALAAARRGDIERALALFGDLADDHNAMGHHARLQLFRLRRDWDGLIAWIEAHPRRDTGLVREAVTFGFYVRALGEVGGVERMVRAYGSVPAAVRRAWGALSTRLNDLFVLALAGQVAAAATVLDALEPLLGAEASDYWLATALQAAGQAEAAAERLRGQVNHADDHLLRDFARDRLAHPLTPVDLDQLPDDVRGTVEALARAVEDDASVATLARPAPGRRAFVTALVSGLLVAVYLIEMPGGATDADNLIRLGALVGPPALLEGEYWRVVTAGLLHYGFVHLALNLVGVWYFGRFLERLLGPWRFLLCYAASGIGAMVLILGWTALFDSRPFLLVGASASLMGIVGASAAVLFRRWRRDRHPRVRRQLVMLGLIVALQTVFDLVTPQVSFAAHFGGALIGLGLGALADVEPRPIPKVTPSPATRSSA